MTSKLYPVAFGNLIKGIERPVLKTVKYFDSYEAARKVVIDYRKKSEIEYTAIQIGCDDISEMAVYFDHHWIVNNHWIVGGGRWEKEEFDKNSPKLCTLSIPSANNKEQNMRLQLGWADSVVELFKTKFGVEFLNQRPSWRDHYRDGTSKRGELSYTCMIPEGSIRALRESYKCVIVKQ
jgi:hypothetical protein